MHKRYSYPGIVVTGPEPIKEETETPLIGKHHPFDHPLLYSSDIVNCLISGQGNGYL